MENVQVTRFTSCIPLDIRACACTEHGQTNIAASAAVLHFEIVIALHPDKGIPQY